VEIRRCCCPKARRYMAKLNAGNLLDLEVVALNFTAYSYICLWWKR